MLEQLFQAEKGGAQDKIKKMEDCGITIANSPSKIGKTLLNKLSN
jgi:succinyl-CoA synthetase alpha subunit